MDLHTQYRKKIFKMTYEELKKIAQPHIREGENLPSNAFLLLTQLHIPFKNETQCSEDYGGKMTPLYNVPAFLAEYKGIRTIYFNSKTGYYNFYIFHEIAHYLLGHEDDSPQNELDADMLACILAAPVKNLPSNIKSARDISTICKIPIDKAEMYWSEIKKEFSNTYKKIIVASCILLALALLISAVSSFNKNPQSPVSNNDSEINPSETVEVIQTQDFEKSEEKNENFFYFSSSGTHYHKKDCQYVKYKTNIISISQEDADTLGLIPCEECIK